MSKSTAEDELNRLNLLAALQLSLDEIQHQPRDKPINSEYCWSHTSPDQGGWCCQHPDCQKGQINGQ